MRRAMLLLGVLACSRPLPTAVRPAPQAEPVRAATVDAGPCAEPDGDGDGVVDVCDVCPDEAGPRPDGCPRRVVIVASEIRITPQVFFAANGAALTPPGRAALDEIVAVLRAHPEVRSVEVRGHASAGERRPTELAQRRAEAARAHLVAQGVEATRLVARGYGLDAPLDANTTPTGRARNRRVDVRILERDDPPSPPERPRRVVPAGCPDAPPPRVGPCEPVTR